MRTALLNWSLVLAAGALFAGCGAAYYVSAIVFVVTQEDKETIDTSFPDSVPTAPVAGAFATLRLSTEQVALTRTVTGGFVVEGLSNSDPTAQFTDFEVLGVDFPPGFGESRSNRDADQTVRDGDKLFLRINGDTVRQITFASADTANVGSAVAAAIQSKVRLLTPGSGSIPLRAYQQFTASFDETTRSYVCVSGASGPNSEVVFQPAPRAGNSSDPTLDAASEATASRLGLGVANGGREINGGDSVRIQVLNRGTDVIPQGTKIRLYLSQDKVLDRRVDPQFDEVTTPETIAVGESRLVVRRNGASPPVRLLRQDFKAGNYYVLYDVEAAGGETITTNNLAFSLNPVEVYQPLDDPATVAVETANAIDFAISTTSSPVSALSSQSLSTSVTLTNLNEPVTTAVPVDLELTLSADVVADPPAYFQDVSTNATKVAGVRINPTIPSRAITVTVDDASAGTTGIQTQVFANTITVRFNGSGSSLTVQDFVNALNTSAGGLVDAFSDGVGSVSTNSLTELIARAGTKQQIAKDVFVTTKRVTYGTKTQANLTQSFSMSGVVRNTIQTAQLPAKLIPFFRIKPQFTSPALADNVRNNVRQARNFLRVYNPATAFFDSDTGVRLPTSGSADFAKLDAVTQRPVNTGSIQQGQQRVFSFQIPDTAATNDESQLLVVVRSTDFDARLDVLSGTGQFLAGSDDSALSTNPVVYTAAAAGGSNRTFYLVVSPARFDESDLASGGETFELTISVNSRQGTDSALLNGVKADNLLRQVDQRYEPQATAPRIENNVLIPYSLQNKKSEIMFVLPQRARVRFRSQPVASSGVTTTITSFLQGAVPTPVDFQAVLDPATSKIVFRPSGGDSNTFHVLSAGVYTVAFEASLADNQKFRLELDSVFLPDGQN